MSRGRRAVEAETLIEYARKQVLPAAILGLPAHQQTPAYWIEDLRRARARRRRSG